MPWWRMNWLHPIRRTGGREPPPDTLQMPPKSYEQGTLRSFLISTKSRGHVFPPNGPVMQRDRWMTTRQWPPRGRLGCTDRLSSRLSTPRSSNRSDVGDHHLGAIAFEKLSLDRNRPPVACQPRPAFACPIAQILKAARLVLVDALMERLDRKS